MPTTYSETSPSLITTPQLRSLWNDVFIHADDEWATVRLWMYLLKEVFGFNGPNWTISPEQPPIGGTGDRERADLQVEYFVAGTGIFHVLFFVEAKARNAGLDVYDQLELQAYRDCMEYMGKQNLREMFAVTVVGTTARLWVCHPDDHYLSPFSPHESMAISDPKSYIEVNSTDGSMLREEFARLKQQAVGLNALPQAPTLPSQH